MIEDEFFSPHDTAVISVPQKAPEGAITRHESALDLLERVKKVHLEWVNKGHRSGQNTNNVSATITIKEPEWEEVGEWMWENRKIIMDYLFFHTMEELTNKHHLKTVPKSSMSS